MKPGTKSPNEEIARLDRFARLLDERFLIPGTGIRIGLDGILGLIPGIGDTLTAAIGLYPLFRARKAGVPFSVIARMAGNLGLDLAVGSIPVLGDIFDVGFKANRRNVDLLSDYLKDRALRMRPSAARRPG